MDLVAEYQKFEPLHQLPHSITCLADYSMVLSRYQLSRDFQNAVYRGEPGLYDTANTQHDTYLISRIARPVVTGEAEFHPYTHAVQAPLNLTREEVSALKTFKEEHADFPIREYSSAWLALAQHFGSNTRLLDFTRDPCVALFFACWSDPPTDSINSEDGVVFLAMPGNLRPQTMTRDLVDPMDIEQGIPASYLELFEPWSVHKVHDKIAHRYIPLIEEFGLNDRIRAQNGMFLWWHPPDQRMHGQVFPLIIKATAKAQILREIAPLGFRPAVLFPDDEGKKIQNRLDEFLKVTT